MYKNKNRNKGVRISLIVALFAVLLGCLGFFVGSHFCVTENGAGSANAVESIEKEPSSVTTSELGCDTLPLEKGEGDSKENSVENTGLLRDARNDGGEGIFAPERNAVATSAATMATAWQNAVNQSISTGQQVTFKLTENWTASSGSFGSGTGFHGGAIYIPSNANMVLDLNGKTISRGLASATQYGYVLLVDGSLEIIDSVGTGVITGGNNSSGTSCIFFEGTTLTLNGGTISGNKGTTGAVYMYRGTFIMNGGTISGNTSSGSGGGVYLRGDGGASAIMNGGKISGNTATKGGGGVYVGGSTTFAMKGGEITGNSSNGTEYVNDGGAGVLVYGATAKFEMTDGSIYSNIAAAFGGGVNVINGIFNLLGGAIYGNTSNRYGGGVYSYAAKITMSNGSVSDNTATYAGGGFYVHSNSTMNFSDGVISGNKLTSTGNYTNYGGGGIILSGSTLNMSGGTISSNVSTSNSGGINVYDSTATITGGKIISNAASTYYGGGISIQQSNKTTTVTLANCTISGNTASTRGGGVYWGDGSLKIGGGVKIIDNTLASGSKNNLHLYSSMQAVITGSLIGTKIGVNRYNNVNVTFTSGYNTYNSGYSPSLYFFADVSGYAVTLSSNEAYLAAGTATAPTATLVWKYSTSANGVFTEIPEDGITYTGSTYYVKAYNGATAVAISSYTYKDANGATQSAIKNAGTYSFIINSTTYTNPSYTLKIAQKEVNISWNNSEFYYTGSAQYPKANLGGVIAADSANVSLVLNTASAGTNAGNYSVTATGLSGTAAVNYKFASGTELTKFYTIKQISLSNATATLSATSATYTGSAISPGVTVTLNGATLASGNYTVTYGNNINAGAATVTIMGAGNYTGSIITTFTINPKSITDAFVTLSGTSAAYTGSAITSITATVKDGSTTLTNNTHYTVKYSNNINAGTAVVMVTGMGNYTGMGTKTFTITPKALTAPTITLGTTSYTYDGTEKKPAVSSVKDGTVAVTTYAVAYSNNVNAGTSATVTLTFSGNYSGTVNKTFTINAAAITNAAVTFGLSNYMYTGTAITAVPTVTLSSKTLAQNVDFTVAYSNNVNAGTSATVTVTGKGNYTGTASGTFTIDKREVFVSGVAVANKEYDGTTKATVDMTTAKISGAVAADLAKLGLEFAAGSEFDGASVGLHYVVVSGINLTGEAAGNYVLDFDEVTRWAQIYPAKVTISGVVANNKVYDGTTFVEFNTDNAKISGAFADELAGLGVNVTGHFNSKNAGNGVGVTVQRYLLTGEFAGNYIIDFENSETELSADIAKAQIDVTLSKNEYTIVYGNALKITYSQVSPVTSESITLALEYWDKEGNIKLSAVPTDAGEYRVKVVIDADDPNLINYTVNTTGAGLISEAKVVIEKAALTVTVEDLAIEYGSAVPAVGDYTLIYNGWLNGDAAAFEEGEISFIKAISITALDYAQGSDVGEYEIVLADGELKNYELNFVDGVLSVYAKKVVVIIDDKTSVYGKDEETLTSDADADVAVKLSRAEGKDVGEYVISGTWSNKNYEVKFVNGIYEITKAKLTVTANDFGITYGEKAANDGATFAGFAFEEDESVLSGTLGFRYTYTQYGNIFEEGTSNKIAYYIIPYGLTAKNYEIEFVNGLLTVNQKDATVTVSNAVSDITSVKGDREEAAKTIKYSIEGALNGDDLRIALEIAQKGLNGVYAVEWCAVGVYDVTAIAGNANYNVTFVFEGGANNGTYTVTQGTLVITANTLIISYGTTVTFGSDLDMAVSVEGLPLGSTLKELIDSGVISGTLAVLPYGDEAYNEFAAIGAAYELGGDIFDESGNRINYIVIPTGLYSSSYNIIFKPGKLMVEPKSIVVNLDNKTGVYGEEEKDLTATVADGALVKFDPETQTVVEFLGITGLKRAEGKDAGSYAITAEGCENKNYRVTFVNGVYTIEQLAINVNWISGNDDEKDFNYIYNGAAQAPVATFEMPDGTVYRSDDLTDKFIEITGSGLNAGSYKAQAFLLNGNLKFAADTDTAFEFTIAKKKLGVKWYADDDDMAQDIEASGNIEYKYNGGLPIKPVVKLDGILDCDLSDDIYYVSGAQCSVSVTVYKAELYILNANYDIDPADKIKSFTIVMASPDGFAWYEDDTYANKISSLIEYTYNGLVQHPVANTDLLEKFIYTITNLDGGDNSAIGVGKYMIVATPVNNNYQLETGKETFYFNIVAKEVSVVWSAETFEYNGKVQVPTAYYVDALGQKVNLTVSGDVGADADTYTVSVTLDTENYTFKVDGEATNELTHTYTITAKEITVEWVSKFEDGKWTVEYNNKVVGDGDIAANVSMINKVEEVGLKMTVMYQAKEGDTPVEVDKIHDAGIYTLSVSLENESANYNVVDADQVFIIEKKKLTVTATNKEVNTGTPAPTLTAEFNGFADNEDALTLGLNDLSGYLKTNYNLSSPYIAQEDYSKNADIYTVSDIAAGGYKGYFIALTNDKDKLDDLSEMLFNYDWTFNYGIMVIVAVEGDVSIVLTQMYNGEDQTPSAVYKFGDKWVPLKVEVYTDDTYSERVYNPVIKDVGDYYILLRKDPNDYSTIDLEGAETEGEFAGCVKKTFTITKRDITVNIGNKTTPYGEVTEEKVVTYLAGLWAYASNDALYQPLEGDELEIALSVEFVFDAAGFAVVRKDGDNIIGYEIAGTWSEDETLRKNYNVIFVGSEGETGLFTITNAKITYVADLTDGFNQIIETDKADGNYAWGLYSKKDGAYEHIAIAGNENASVKISYSTIYNQANYALSDKLPQSEDEIDGATGKNGWTTVPTLDLAKLQTANGSYFVNFKIEVENHDTYYGQWTIEIIAGKAYIRIIFSSEKQYELTYGEKAPTGAELAAKLLNEGYVSCLDLPEDMFLENVLNGNLTAKVLADGALNTGSYAIVFEGIENLNADWIISYKRDVNGGDDTATNLNKFVVKQCKITLNWDNTTFDYDGTAHMPTPSIDGWTVTGTTQSDAGTVYTFENDVTGLTLNLVVRTNGGDFTTVGSENIVIAEIEDGNYALDSFNATRAVSILGVGGDNGSGTAPITTGGIPEWVMWMLIAIAAVAVLVIVFLAIKKGRKPAADDDGFYDDVNPEDL